LLAWAEENGRDFAWRHTRDPYQLLMAEMMVQRTRAAQAETVWLEFVRRYPTVKDADSATDADLINALSGLGLKWRATKIVAAIRQIAEDWGGDIPDDQARLESLPGVGHYAASAARTVAFGARVAVVDANVVRVYSRFFGLSEHDRLRRSRNFHALVGSVLPQAHRSEWVWALLDFGAGVCKPRAPRCARCPLSTRCVYAARGEITA
jgi:A/G-specific adenine glycosylase